MMVAAVPLVGAVCGIAFSDRELMVGVVGFVLSLSILGSRARSGRRRATAGESMLPATRDP